MLLAAVTVGCSLVDAATGAVCGTESLGCRVYLMIEVWAEFGICIYCMMRRHWERNITVFMEREQNDGKQLDDWE